MDRTDSSTVQSNWLNVGNADSQRQASCKEIIDLPLVSAYNQAFLETITEEGSEFEPSEDGSFSWGNHADSYQVEILSNDSVHKNLGLGLDQQMIGDLECPVDYIDLSDISLSMRGPLGSDQLAGSRDIEQLSTELCMVDQTTQHLHEAVNRRGSYDGSPLNERFGTSHYQRYDNIDPKQPEDVRLVSGKTHERKDFLRTSPAIWTEPRHKEMEEEVLVLSADSGTNKLCWKLESIDVSQKESRAVAGKDNEFPWQRRCEEISVTSDQKTNGPQTKACENLTNRPIEPHLLYSGDKLPYEYPKNCNLFGPTTQSIRHDESILRPVLFKESQEKMHAFAETLLSRHTTSSFLVDSQTSTTSSTFQPVSRLTGQGSGSAEWSWQPHLQGPFSPHFPTHFTTNCRKTENHCGVWSHNSNFPVIQPCSQRFQSRFQGSSLIPRPPPLPKAMATSHFVPCFPSTNPVSPCDRNNTSNNSLNSSRMFNQTRPFSPEAEKPNSSLAPVRFEQSSAQLANDADRLWKRNPASENLINKSDEAKEEFDFYCSHPKQHYSNVELSETRAADQYYSVVDINPVGSLNIKPTGSMRMVYPSFGARNGLYENVQAAETKPAIQTRGEIMSKFSQNSGFKPGQLDIVACVRPTLNGTSKIKERMYPSGVEFQSSMWVANSTPRSELSANSSEPYEAPQITVQAETFDSKSDSPNVSELKKPSVSNGFRPLHRSPAVLGVSELLSKTDEELCKFMEDVRIPKVQERTSPQGSEATQNQITSMPTDHSPARRRFHYINNQNSKASYCENLGTDSASDQLDRRSFYDYGCDDEDEEADDDEDLFEPPGVNSLNERLATRISHPTNPSNHSALHDRTHLYNMPYETASSILDDIMKLDMDGSRYVWSDTCHSPHSTKQDHIFSKPNNHVLGRDIFEPWDLPYIDSDAFAGEPWAAIYGPPLETFLRRPKKASLDEITLTSKPSSCRNSWGSASDLNRFGRELSSREVDNDHESSNRSRTKRVRIRSRRDFHSYDISTDTKSASRLRKITGPWFQRLCGCVRSSRFRKKDLH
ncbi:hypothetical protein CRM22_009412 [Opisthorchis felineus]|uniref:Uncharacterized protein n=1 Tax=Opisthorchis felineus TaxID=147828 RepID=A0A4V6RGS7_OPIFE|nr:hypothetical protein CRM22_009412 [Opisthorchis felineus]